MFSPKNLFHFIFYCSLFLVLGNAGCRKNTSTLQSSNLTFHFSPYSAFSTLDTVYFYADDSTIPAHATIEWTFGDGHSASGHSASHAYAVSGNYVATMKVNNNDSVQSELYIRPYLTSPHTLAMGGMRIWHTILNMNGSIQYSTDTFAIQVMDAGVVKFQNTTFFCENIDTSSFKGLTFHSSTFFATLSYYYIQDSIEYYQYTSFPPPLEHGFDIRIIHSP